jgi:hypothetical protein
MKQRFQGIVMGFLMATLLLGTVNVLASTRTINVTYGINVVVDGIRQVFSDDMMPFTSEGRTFLPVRGIADALGLDASWDGTTSTVYINSGTPNNYIPMPMPEPTPIPTPEPTQIPLRPAGFLDDIQHSNFSVNNSFQTIFKIHGLVTDHLNNRYDNGLVFRTNTWATQGPNYVSGHISNDPDNAQIIVEYPLNNQYKLLTGSVFIPQSIDVPGFRFENIRAGNSSVTILFYGEGHEPIYRASSITPTIPHNLSVDVSDVQTLTIKIIVNGNNFNGMGYVGFTDLQLFN